VTEVTWYARLAVWVGVVVLLIQSVTGRGNPPVTVVAVILLIGGFLVFIAGLATSGLSRLTPGLANGTADSTTGLNDRHAAAQMPVDEVGEATVLEPAPSGAPEQEPEPMRNLTTATSESTSPPSWGSVLAVDVTRDAPELGSICPRCHIGIQEGQIAATCFVCGHAHHAACWTENHFHCATPGCEGRGSLEAPGPSGRHQSTK
jgi:hypothetical protein